MADERAVTPREPRRLRLFLRAALPDFLLTLMVSVALTYTVSYAFEAAATLRGNVGLEAGLCALVLVPLFAGAWSKRALAPAALGCIVVCAAIVGGLGSLGTEPLFAADGLNDAEGSYAVLGLVLCTVTVLTYLLSRRGLGVFALFAIALLSCGVVQFLYRDWVTAQPGVVAFACVLAGVLMMFVYQTYRSGIRGARHLKRTSFAAVLGGAVVIVGVCMALAFALYYLLVAGAGLSTLQVKLFQDYYQRPVVEYTGVYSEQDVNAPELATNRVSDDAAETNQDAAGGSLADETVEESSSNPITGIAQQLQAFGVDSWVEQFQTIGYEVVAATLAGVLAILALALLLAVLVRRWLRERWLRQMEGMPPGEQVDAVYSRLTRGLAHLGIKRPPTLTPLEHALASRHVLAPFDVRAVGPTFVQMTLAYQRVAYGNGDVGEAEAAALRRYYRAFVAQARSSVGRVRWALLFWRL